MFNLEDFIPVYPDQNDPDIQKIITNKQEFVEKGSKLREPEPKRGDLFLHQELNLRFMLAFDKCLWIHEAGSGKSCGFLSIARHYRKYRSVYKRVYIIEKGDSVINEMKNQIVYKCSDEYETNAVKNSKNQKQRSMNITKEIKKWITLCTYGSFIQPLVKDKLNDEQISEMFSDCIFFLDEAHNLKNDKDNIDENDINKNMYDNVHKIFHLAKRSKFVIATATPGVNEVNEIPRIINLLLDNNEQMPLNWDYKKVSFEQIEPFLRGKISFVRSPDTGIKIINMGQKIMQKYEIEVPISTWIPPEFNPNLAQPIPPMEKIVVDSQIYVWPSIMKGKQLIAYKNAMEKIVETKENMNFSEKPTFWLGLRQASCVGFPDGSYGGTFKRLHKNSVKKLKNGINTITNKEWEPMGLGKYIKSEKKDVYEVTPELMEYISDPKKIELISCKAAEILKIEKEGSGDGCAWIYSDFISGGGVFFIAQVLEANGFEIYNNSESAFEDIFENGIIKKKIKPEITKKRRYSVLTHDSSGSEMTPIKELFNSNNNVYGDYIQIFISSPTGKEGISLNHVVRGHTYTTSWNYSSTIQSESRFLRATSYEYRLKIEKEKIKEEKDKYFKKYRTEEDLEKKKKYKLKYEELNEKYINYKIEVKIYKHVAIYEDPEAKKKIKRLDLKILETTDEKKIKKYIKKKNKINPIESIDLKIYQHSELKEINIRRFIRFLKKASVDTFLNYERNIRPDDIDYSINCDYEVCNYNIDINNKNIDYSTYDILYSNDLVEKCILDITNKLKIEGYLDFDNIKKIWIDTKKYREKIVLMSIEKILLEHRKLNDRFGFECYLYIHKNILYTKKEYPLKDQDIFNNMFDFNKEYISIYNNKIIGIHDLVFEELLNLKQVPEQNDIINKIKNIEDFTIEENIYKFNLFLEELSINSKVEILEEAMSKKINKQELNKYDKAILYTFRAYTYLIREPWEDIEKMIDYLKKKGDNKKINNFDFIGEPKENSFYKNGKEVEYISVHTLYSSKISQSGHETASNFLNVKGDIKILKKSDNLGWRKATPYEYLAYQNIIKNKIDKIFSPTTESEIYGIILYDKNLRIHDKMLENKVITNKKDNSIIGKGKICLNWNKGELINIIIRKGVKTQHIEEIFIENNKREDMIAFLHNEKHTSTNSKQTLENTDDETLERLCKWYKSGYTVLDICKILQYYLDEQKLLIII